MGLKIQQRATIRARVITTLIAVFALVLQPAYGFVAGRVANATTGPSDGSKVAACNGGGFDSFVLGSVNGQNGWHSTGSYDQAVVANSYGYTGFGCKALRLSNAVTSGSFGDQTFSDSTANDAGESLATTGGRSGGVRQNHYEASFDIASTELAQQPGLAISVSPDRGDGSRMSYLRFEDGTNGMNVFFYDVTGTTSPANFNKVNIASDLSRATPHNIKFVIDFKDGPSNYVVQVYVDGNLVHTGTTWENYYRYDAESNTEPVRTVDSLLFRAGGTAAPATSGKGYLFDNVNIITSTIKKDTVPPTVTMGVPTTNTSGLYSVSGTTDDIASDVFVTVGGGAARKALITPTTGNNGIWTAVLGLLNAGQQYSIVASSSDSYSNSSTTEPYLLTVPTVVTSNEPAIAIIETPVLPVIVARTDSSNNFNTVGPATTFADPAAVLGAQTAKADSAVLGASENVAAIAPSEQGWKIFGMAWFWWVLIVAAIASIIWWIVAAARRRSQNA